MNVDQIRRLERQALEQLLANAQRLGATGNPKQKVAAAALLQTIEALPEDAWIEIQFRDPKLTARHRQLIKVVADHPGSTSAELSQHMGWKNQNWHLYFGSMCRDRLSGHVATDGAAIEGNGAEQQFYTSVLCHHDDATGGFTLKDEARAALTSAGVLEGGEEQAAPAATPVAEPVA